NAIARCSVGTCSDGQEANINDVYPFLLANYEPGDAIYLFGFSRGAYTARSIAGMVRRCGILRRENARQYPEAKALYKSGVKAADPKAQQFRKDFAIEDDTPIQCVGVWDTVGALGIPVHGFNGFNEKKFGFLDTSLSSAVKFAFHALSVDERRGPFKPVIYPSCPPPHPALRATLAPLRGARGSRREPVECPREALAVSMSSALLPARGEKVPEGRMRGGQANPHRPPAV